MAEKKKYPTGEQHYALYEEVGQGVSATVRRALCKPFNEIVAIKILDFERDNCDLNCVFRETQTMVMIDHPNILKSHCSFVCGHDLWVVMPYMAGGSCLHILKSGYSRGLPEVVIATILRETLRGLEYLHRHGHIHRDVKSGNILIDSHGAIKLGDFGVSACLFDSGDRQRVRNTFVGTPCWMAPEVMELSGYDFKADIWSFGITALELAHGNAPFSRYPPMKVLLMTLQTTPPCLESRQGNDFTTSFKHMVGTCLLKDPTKRPTAKKLLKHSFFKQARSSDYISRTLLEGLPALGDRVMELKKKDEAMNGRKKVPSGQMEEMSQSEYKRGISSWFFDPDMFRAAMDIEEPIDDSVSENSQPESSNSPSVEENNYATPFVQSALDDDRYEEFHDEKAKEPVVQQRGRFKVTSENVDVGKVSSTLTLEKSPSTTQATTPPMSQVLQFSTMTSRPSSPPNAASSNNCSLFSFLNTVLETNIVQRDIILNIMKHAAAGGFTADRGCTSSDTLERNLLEEAHEKEKELLREIIDLKERTLTLIKEEELQKSTTGN